jgi:hypothetical protein
MSNLALLICLCLLCSYASCCCSPLTCDTTERFPSECEVHRIQMRKEAIPVDSDVRFVSWTRHSDSAPK